MPEHVDLDRLFTHVDRLARAPRPAESPELEAARSFAADELQSAGFTVRREPVAGIDEMGTQLNGVNLVATHPALSGNGPRFCIGAHLDSRPDSPGADDNASAVATLLELARLLPVNAPASCAVDLELVVFDLEENGMLGSVARADRMRSEGIDLCGMVSLEMLGYCDHRENSQSLPRSLVGLYPDVGNFIAVIGNQNSERLASRFRLGMERVEELPVESLIVPENGNLLQATRLSDHSPYWDAGFPALMITDTSFLRNPHYHLPSDTPETLDRDFLGRVAQGCLEAAREIVTNGL